MTGTTVMEVATEVGGVKVEVHPTGQVRVQGSRMVQVLFSGRVPSKEGDAWHVELVAVASIIPDRLRVEIRRALGPWFDINPALVARLDPDTGRGERIIVSSSGGDRRGSEELGSVTVGEPRLLKKLSLKAAGVRRHRPGRSKAAKRKSSRDLVRG